MRKKLNMRKIIIASLALVFVLVTIVTSIFAAYRFTKTVEDEDVIIGKISNVSKSFLSYKKSSITQTSWAYLSSAIWTPYLILKHVQIMTPFFSQLIYGLWGPFFICYHALPFDLAYLSSASATK